MKGIIVKDIIWVKNEELKENSKSIIKRQNILIVKNLKQISGMDKKINKRNLQITNNEGYIC